MIVNLDKKLIAACFNNNKNEVKDCLKQGAKDLTTAFEIACFNDNMSIASLLINEINSNQLVSCISTAIQYESRVLTVLLYQIGIKKWPETMEKIEDREILNYFDNL